MEFVKKPSVLCLFGMLSLLSTEISAQRQQITEYYRPPLDYPMDGKITYSFIVDENGENLKDGPLSIKASLNNFVTYVMLRKMTINGNYNLTANFLKGRLNGALSLNSRLTCNYGSETQSESLTLRGNFKNGIPNGNFVADYNTRADAKMNVTYNNGKLVGPYMVKYSDGVTEQADIKGTLTSSGELTGKWIWDGTTDTFLNGVRISSYSKDSGTPPALVEKSRQFANGTISEEKLMEQGIMVFEDSVNLSEHTNNIILRDNVISFRDLKGYNFSTSNFKKFKYLQQMVYLTDEGFNVLQNSIKNAILKNNFNNEVFGQTTSSTDQYRKVVATDERGVQYVKMGSYYYHLTTAGKYNGKIYDRIYLTKEQSAVLDQRIEQIRRECAVDLTGLIEILNDYDLTYNFKSMKMNGADNLSVQESTKLYGELSKILIDTLKTTSDNQYYVMNSQNGTFYVDRSAPEEFMNTRDKLLSSIKDHYSKLYPNITVDYNANILSYIDMIDVVLKNLNYLIDKSSASISYGDDAYYYFCTEGVENQKYWEVELSRRIKKFTKITNIRLTGIYGNKIECEFTRKGKEVYKTSIMLKDKKILVTSINFDEAKLISGE